MLANQEGPLPGQADVIVRLLVETRDSQYHRMLVLKEHLHLGGQFPQASAGSANSLHIPASPTEVSRHHGSGGSKSPTR